MSENRQIHTVRLNFRRARHVENIKIIFLTVDQDFRLVFYVAGTFMVASMVIIFFGMPNKREARKGKESNDSFFSVMKKISCPATIILFSQCFTMGIMAGIYQNQAILYMQDILGATPEMFSYSIAISMGAGIILAPLQTLVIEAMGVANILFMAVFINSSRLLCFAFIEYTF